MFNLIVIILSLVAVANFILGITILSQSFRSRANLLFSLICLGAFAWSAGIIGFYLIRLPDNLSSLWILITHFSAAIIALTFFYFTLIFPNVAISRKFLYVISILPFIVITYFLFFTKSIIGNVFDSQYKINFGYVFYSFYILTYFFAGYLFLFLQNKKSKDNVEKIQIKYVLFGAILSSLLASITDLILPFIGIFQYIWLGPVFTLFLVIFIAYAILKHHLFNIKIITTELLTFAIWITLLIKVFSSSGLQDAVINSVIFAVMVFLGILLIRSVIKEVRQREEIAQMAEDVKRAYVVEKRAKEELEQLDKFKDQFLLTAQHNLRTPLTSIMGYSDLLLNGTFGKQNKKTLEVIGKLQILTQGMIKMVNNFLDMAQFQLGKSVINLKPGVKVASLVNEVIGELKFKAESKGIFLNFDASEQLPVINADSEKLKAALFNIIDNAVKYTTKGGVSVKVSDQNTNDQNLKPNTLNRKSILIVIRDTGIGIPEEKLSVMFESQFERSEAAKKITSMGSGVGLYLAGQIIKAHNGRVWAESEGEGKGSAFFVELPMG